MANICSFSGRVLGEKENVREFLAIIFDMRKDKFFSRLWNVYQEKDAQDLPDGRTLVSFSGECAWSVASCMLNREDENSNCLYSKNITLQEVTRDLKLDVEIISSEIDLGLRRTSSNSRLFNSRDTDGYPSKAREVLNFVIYE